VRYADWGERTARWAGVRSEFVDVDGVSVHLLGWRPCRSPTSSRAGSPGSCSPTASVVRSLFLDRRPVEAATDRIRSPTLLLWGDQDPLVDRAAVEHLPRRHPGWDHDVFPAVGRWLHRYGPG
jgi:pimeloyl-ACP methyl ester carboxylesterase